MNIIPKKEKNRCPYCGYKYGKKGSVCPICKAGGKMEVYEEKKK